MKNRPSFFTPVPVAVAVVVGCVLTCRISAKAETDTPTPSEADFLSRVSHDYAENDGVKIHYASVGSGPLVLMIHGFPDFWYTWRRQMDALSADYRVVAMDLRGYNLSDQPDDAESYHIDHLTADVAAVIRHLKRDRAIVVGHDWGGFIAWTFAMRHPERVERLIVLNLPHPRGLMRELATNPAQQRNSEYARRFQQPDAHLNLTAETLAGWVEEPEAKQRYIAAFRRSSLRGMLDYYRQNYPREPYRIDESPVVKVTCPVLLIHGLKDPYLLAGGLNGTWDWVANELTLVTIPSASHFVQHDAPEKVTDTIRTWLSRDLE